MLTTCVVFNVIYRIMELYNVAGDSDINCVMFPMTCVDFIPYFSSM